MSTRFAGASLIAMLCLAGASPASAADLSGDPYDDPRYAEVYRDGPPPHANKFVRRYEERYEERGHASYKDGDDDRYDDRGDVDVDDYRGGDRYGNGDGYGRDNGYGRGGHCVPRHLIRRQLIEEGWGDFQGLQVRHDYVVLQARRPSGRIFDLKVDRCTGRIVNAKACDGPYYGRYAHGPRRHYRY